MTTAERSVLHVLPHPGGGGETYVDLLAEMSGYRFGRLYLGRSSKFAPGALACSLAAVVREVRRYDLVHVHGEVAAGLCLAVLTTRPSIVTLHGLHVVRRLSGARRTAAVLNLRAVLRAADQTICVSESEHEELSRVVGANATRRAVVIRNGVRLPVPVDSAERVVVRNALGIVADEVVAIWVGSLDERKNPLAAVRAAEAAKVTLVVVGDGPLRGPIECETSRWVRVLGERDDVPRLLAASDVFVLTSQREGLSFSLLEAMAHGLAPVVTNLPENMEAVGDAGLGVELDGVSLSSALHQLATDDHTRTDLGARALQRVSRLFSAAEMRQRTRALYNDALARDRIAAS